LIGKWKLVKQTQNGQVTNPKDTYQEFMAGNIFEGTREGKSRKGTWKLSEDNKTLTIGVSVIKVKYDIIYFDATKRTISNPELGTLEYEKVNE
jgi:hypothetical protein